MKRKVIIRNRGVSYNNITVEVQRIRKLDECEGGGTRLVISRAYDR